MYNIVNLTMYRQFTNVIIIIIIIIIICYQSIHFMEEMCEVCHLWDLRRLYIYMTT